MNQGTLIPHLFKTEFSKIVAVIGKYLGVQHLEFAEDIASETFLNACESWPYNGIPPNPVAWLYSVAKNKARNMARRQQLMQQKIMQDLQQQALPDEPPELDLSERNIADSQLQMLFAICHPTIPVESQIGLALRILCGFGIDEIATALLTNRETINKRLYRAREKLRTENISIEVPGSSEVEARLNTVLATIYLLFSEGYYSETNPRIIREELCMEALHLLQLLLNSELTNRPNVHALFALMCFQASRFPARKQMNGHPVLYDDQDETLWDRELIAKGAWHFKQSAAGSALSQYHLEAGIAWWYTVKNDVPEKWQQVLQLYNQLLQLQYSPVAAMNRTFAFSKVYGKTAGIAEALKLKLNASPSYFALLGYLYEDVNDQQAVDNFRSAIEISRNEIEKANLQKHVERLLSNL